MSSSSSASLFERTPSPPPPSAPVPSPGIPSLIVATSSTVDTFISENLPNHAAFLGQRDFDLHLVRMAEMAPTLEELAVHGLEDFGEWLMTNFQWSVAELREMAEDQISYHHYLLAQLGDVQCACRGQCPCHHRLELAVDELFAENRPMALAEIDELAGEEGAREDAALDVLMQEVRTVAAGMATLDMVDVATQTEVASRSQRSRRRISYKENSEDEYED